VPCADQADAVWFDWFDWCVVSVQAPGPGARRQGQELDEVSTAILGGVAAENAGITYQNGRAHFGKVHSFVVHYLKPLSVSQYLKLSPLRGAFSSTRNACWLNPIMLAIRHGIIDFFPVTSINSEFLGGALQCVFDSFKPTITGTATIFYLFVLKQIDPVIRFKHHETLDLGVTFNCGNLSHLLWTTTKLTCQPFNKQHYLKRWILLTVARS
jgi:hypothetical protein